MHRSGIGHEAKPRFALAQGAFCFAAWRVIAKSDDDADRSAFRLQRRRAVHNRKETAILPNERVLVLAKFDSLLQNLQARAVAGREGTAVGMLVMRHVVHVPAEQFSVRPPEHGLCSRIHVRDQSVQIEGVHARGHVVHGQAEAFFALAQSRVCLLGLRDVARNLGRADDPASRSFTGETVMETSIVFPSFETRRFHSVQVSHRLAAVSECRAPDRATPEG